MGVRFADAVFAVPVDRLRDPVPQRRTNGFQPYVSIVCDGSSRIVAASSLPRG
jgi:hypothetical protein